MIIPDLVSGSVLDADQHEANSFCGSSSNIVKSKAHKPFRCRIVDAEYRGYPPALITEVDGSRNLADGRSGIYIVQRLNEH